MKRKSKRAKIIIKQEKLPYDNSINLATNDSSALDVVKEEVNTDIKVNLDILNQTRVRPKRKAAIQAQYDDYDYEYEGDSDYEDEDEIEDEDEDEDEIEDEEDINGDGVSDIDEEAVTKSEILNATSLNGMFINLLSTQSQ